MKPIRYIAYGMSALLVITGIFLMTYGGARIRIDIGASDWSEVYPGAEKCGRGR